MLCANKCFFPFWMTTWQGHGAEDGSQEHQPRRRELPSNPRSRGSRADFSQLEQTQESEEPKEKRPTPERKEARRLPKVWFHGRHRWETQTQALGKVRQKGAGGSREGSAQVYSGISRAPAGWLLWDQPWK